MQSQKFSTVLPCALQATISYGKKPNEAFLLHYGFVDTSYKADFYSADLLEYVEQQYDIPADRVTALATNHKLHAALESVSLCIKCMIVRDT